MLGPDSGLAEPTSVGFWEGPNKWIWSGGDLARFDLAADPAEMNPTPMRADATPGPLDDAIVGLAELMSRHLERDEELLETLRALGYVE